MYRLKKAATPNPTNYQGNKTNNKKECNLKQRRTSYLNKCVIPAIINLEDGCHVATPVTVIRCAEYGHHLLFL